MPKKAPINFIPTSTNFSRLEEQSEIDGEEFDVADELNIQDELEMRMDYEILILTIFPRLDEIQQKIFLYQLLKSAGFSFTRKQCADSLGLKIKQYIYQISKLKAKIGQILAEK